MVLLQAFRDVVQVRHGGLHGHALFHPPDGAQIVPPALLPILLGHGQRPPQVGAAGKIELFRHYAHHVVHFAAEVHALAQHVAAAAEAPLPQPVAQNHHMMRPELVFLLGKRAAQRGLRVQHVEKVGGDAEGAQPLRLAEAGIVHVVVRAGGNAGEGVIVVAVGLVIAGRDGKLGKSKLEIALADLHQLVSFVKVQRLQKHGINDGEDGAVGADAEGESQDGDEREAGISS
jgi:hypothetical protein